MCLAIYKKEINHFNDFFLEFFYNFLIIKLGGGKITFKYRYKKQIIITIVIIVIIVILAILSIYFIKLYPQEKVSSEIKTNDNYISKEPDSQKEQYKVDIKGEVINPGIYTLDINSRVIDVINMAGGLSENANTTVINLSKKITDEMVIIIYSNEEVANFKKTKEIEEQVVRQCEQKDENALTNSACITPSKEETISSTNVSINNATKEELMTLPGIGESKAEEIIKYRSEHSGFTNVEQLKEISGIGESLFAKIKDHITL